MKEVIPVGVTERFLKYVSFDTQSDPNSVTVPSTSKQLLLGNYLYEELKSIGLKNAMMDEYGIVYGWLPASEGMDHLPGIGFISHMDTAPVSPGKNVKPRIIYEYKGDDIELGDGVVTRVDTFDHLKKYIGEDLIVTDGKTLLGADDKAGIAEIMTAMEFLVNHPEIKHGKLCVAFTPDEEIGRGANNFNIKLFGAGYAYTVDAGPIGQIRYDNPNSCRVDIKIEGVFVHPGYAKGKLNNAILIAHEFISMLPPAESPAHTEGHEGYYHISEICGKEAEVNMTLIISEHDKDKFIKRKSYIIRIAEYLNHKHGEGTIGMKMTDRYYNMKEKILPVMHIVDRAINAFKKCGIEPDLSPSRGGTDGVRLSYEGLPCPNISAGEKYAHGVHEFISIQSMEKMVKVIVEIAKA